MLATGNPGKVRELRRMLAGVPFDVVGAGERDVPRLDVVEDGETYAENAAKKARAYATATGALALADDSGIEVDALGGRPGLRSARYGGEGLDDAGRTALLLHELESSAVEARAARFRAVVAIAMPGEDDVALFEGAVAGRIALAPRGAHGFGYDPVFELADGRTAAELSDCEWDAISHRGIAMRAAAAHLRTLA